MVLILVQNNNPALYLITDPIYFSTNNFKWGLEIINEILY